MSAAQQETTPRGLNIQSRREHVLDIQNQLNSLVITDEYRSVLHEEQRDYIDEIQRHQARTEQVERPSLMSRAGQWCARVISGNIRTP